uniref:Poly [ADP-ribose] polymerase n=1 Tax=Alexandrium monilatum TaxID=311494 RepID=A0A7S4T592_9DINO
MTAGLDGGINELYLTHGTKPEVVLSVISGGLNERYSGGVFGHGTYFAEDLGKNDQYVTEDVKFGDHAELHKELYSHVRHPGKVFYVFLCRVAFGHFCTTRDARTDSSGASIWPRTSGSWPSSRTSIPRSRSTACWTRSGARSSGTVNL